jgi:hypothetical protein
VRGVLVDEKFCEGDPSLVLDTDMRAVALVRLGELVLLTLANLHDPVADPVLLVNEKFREGDPSLVLDTDMRAVALVRLGELVLLTLTALDAFVVDSLSLSARVKEASVVIIDGLGPYDDVSVSLITQYDGSEPLQEA